MREIQLNTTGSQSKIIVGESLKNITRHLNVENLMIITDKNVSRYHRNDFPEAMILEIEPGEKSKSLVSANRIYGELISHEMDKKTFILGIGGGIVCDLAGFVASTYQRGLRFGFVASTLLAQVDASIGGKNGVNFEGYKNMVGVIRQPEFVVCDLDLLKTLEKKEFISGFAEIVKYGAIFDYSLFCYLESHVDSALDMNREVMEKLVFDCALLKTKVVEADENEKGERKKLNFGHTFAHGLEKLTGMSHGEAVSIGMVMASELSRRLGYISAEDAARLRKLLNDFGLPVSFQINGNELFEVMKMDKKRGGNKISLILLRKLGEAVIEEIDISQLKSWMNDLC